MVRGCTAGNSASPTSPTDSLSRPPSSTHPLPLRVSLPRKNLPFKVSSGARARLPPLFVSPGFPGFSRSPPPFPELHGTLSFLFAQRTNLDPCLVFCSLVAPFLFSLLLFPPPAAYLSLTLSRLEKLRAVCIRNRVECSSARARGTSGFVNLTDITRAFFDVYQVHQRVYIYTFVCINFFTSYCYL